MTLGQRMKDLRTKKGLTMEQLGDIFGVTKTAVSNWESENRTPDKATVIKLADFFKVSIDYLYGRKSDEQEMLRIPVLGLVKAGIPSEAIEEVLDWEEIPRTWLRGGKEFFALRISGDSMSPRIEEDDVIIVQKQQWCDNGDIVVVRVNGEDATVKKVIKQENGILLVAFNSEYEPIFYSHKQMKELPVEYLGKVIELRGKF